MGSLIKSLVYELRKDKLIIMIFLVTLIMQIVALCGEWDTELTGSSYLASSGYYMSLVAMIFVLAFTGEVCGADFADKTMNYEMMSGHTRRQAYFSRAIISMIGGICGAVILMLVPLVIASAACGWGTVVTPGGAALRIFLSLLPFLRLICEFIFLSYLVKNPYIVMALSFFSFILGQSLPMYIGNTPSIWLGMTNLFGIFTFSEWSVYSMNLTVYSTYETAIAAGDVAATVLASLIFGGLFLMLGYWYFKKDDLN